MRLLKQRKIWRIKCSVKYDGEKNSRASLEVISKQCIFEIIREASVILSTKFILQKHFSFKQTSLSLLVFIVLLFYVSIMLYKIVNSVNVYIIVDWFGFTYSKSILPSQLMSNGWKYSQY